MKVLFWTALLLFFFQPLQAQDSTFKWMEEVQIKTTLRLKGPVKVTERKASYTDPKTGQPLGNFRLLFAVDTAHRRLLNIVTVERTGKEKEKVTIYYFDHDLLAQVAIATRQNEITQTDNLFTYSPEDNALDGPQLEHLRQNSEKFDLLRTARQYILSFQNDQAAGKK
ncbi:hypothetical protein V9K67_17010 [Paraflavisolibacter sp. H34]|uniref:hypothetical protein n=1 Tax=Huijunlia imazamoxiresistens TaxID=3127457 RepID=UPI00301A2431